MGYPFDTIWVNGRDIRLEHIIRKKVEPQSPFEQSAFDFIAAWFLDAEKFLFQTSGTTGDPKKVVIGRKQMTASAALSQQVFQYKAGDTSLVCIDPAFIGGRMMFVRSFLAGMKVLMVDPCASPLNKVPIDICVNFAALVPYQLKSILESHHSHRLDTIDTVIIGGAPLSSALEKRLQPYQCRAYATYGMTETVSHIALQLVNGAQKQDHFTTLPGIKVSVDSRDCLRAKVPFLSEEIQTNDVVELLDDRNFRWLGRADNAINSGGVKVHPEKVEQILSSFLAGQGIHNSFFVYGTPDEKLGFKVTLFVEGNEEIRSRVEAAVIEARNALQNYDRPRAISIVRSFALSEGGKINRSATAASVEHSAHSLI